MKEQIRRAAVTNTRTAEVSHGLLPSRTAALAGVAVKEQVRLDTAPNTRSAEASYGYLASRKAVRLQVER